MKNFTSPEIPRGVTGIDASASNGTPPLPDLSNTPLGALYGVKSLALAGLRGDGLLLPDASPQTEITDVLRLFPTEDYRTILARCTGEIRERWSTRVQEGVGKPPDEVAIVVRKNTSY
ncbi:hypothetical protein IPL85_05280 [Candidatus Saccharibacteria bacterium]|nr:MAG: hypothetical protein IPL85_05280 [Candidatus Saccharibacteria bacterium]